MTKQVKSAQVEKNKALGKSGIFSAKKKVNLNSCTASLCTIVATVAALVLNFGMGASSSAYAATSDGPGYSSKQVKLHTNPNSVEKYVRVAFSGFFDPTGSMFGSSSKKKYYKKYKKPKKGNAKKITPKYNLGFNNAKGHFKKYEFKSNGYTPQFDELDQNLIKKKYLRRNKNVGGYRTMCVRLKDGYYWPISFSRTKAEFKKDRIKCQKSCSGKVRLFYYNNTSDDLASMRDLKGKRYSSLKTAFLYRKKYIKEATCKPKPWSAAAKAVHKKYAILDKEKKRRMHIAQAKRAEKLRVAALTSKRKYRKLKAKYARSLNTEIKKARRTRRAKLKRKYRARQKVARLYKAKKVYRPSKKKYKKKKYKSYSYTYNDYDDW